MDARVTRYGADISKAISVSPKPVYFRIRCEAKFRVAELQKRGYLDAISDCDQAIALDPAHHYSYGLKGYMHFLQNTDVSAITNLNKAIELGPRVWV